MDSPRSTRSAMSQLYVCPQGHRSQLAANVQTQPRPAQVLCPVCGARAQAAPVANAPAPPREAPTIAADAQAIKKADDPRERTLLTAPGMEPTVDARTVPGYH